MTTPLAPRPAADGTPTASTGAEHRSASVLSIVLAVVVGAIWAVPTSTGGFAGFLGAWTGNLIWPLLIAYLARGRKRDWRAFSRWFFWLTLIVPPLPRAATRH
jgi:hypothetical protein